MPGARAHWFALCGTHGDATGLHELAGRYRLHPLAVEDCLSPALHTPKIDAFSDHLFVVLQAWKDATGEPAFEELDIFLGEGFLITYHDEPIDEIGAVAQALRNGVRPRPGPDGLLYEVVDRMVDAMLPPIDAFGSALDDLEERSLTNPGTQEQAHAIVQLRASAGRVRRVLSPQLTVLQRLSRGEFDAIAEPNRIYFRDIYDHLLRIDLALEGVREDAEVALSTYLSALNNRLSEVMKVLSVVAALALPATVISGIFGTNFDNVPGLHSNWGFGFMLGAMAAVAVGMWYYFRRRGWF